jgi:hypothetical protein
MQHEVPQNTMRRARPRRQPAPLSPRTKWIILGLFLLVAIPPWFIVAVLVRFTPSVEMQYRKALERREDPNHHFVASLGTKAWRDPQPGTFEGLNGGRWTRLCVNGGETDPIETFETAFGPHDISDELRDRFNRSQPVATYDLAVSFADHQGKVDVVYVVEAGSLQSLHQIACMRHP